jgi:hypothetical protein
MTSSGTDNEDTAEFVFESEDEPPEREDRVEPIEGPPEVVVRAGRRVKLTRWELLASGGHPSKTRFFYRLFGSRTRERPPANHHPA